MAAANIRANDGLLQSHPLHLDRCGRYVSRSRSSHMRRFLGEGTRVRSALWGRIPPTHF